MISLIPIHRIVVTVAVIYALMVSVVLYIYWHYVDAPTLIASIKFALAGATALNATLLGIIFFAWKSIWKKFPILNTLIFPNLNGLWGMKIHWVGNDASGIVHANATIKQSLVGISMEVDSTSSDSETLLAHPKKDSASGRPLLYYVYRVVPKQIDVDAGATYEGAAILKFDAMENGSLKGNYFTSRQTKGYFTLERK